MAVLFDNWLRDSKTDSRVWQCTSKEDCISNKYVNFSKFTWKRRSPFMCFFQLNSEINLLTGNSVRMSVPTIIIKSRVYYYCLKFLRDSTVFLNRVSSSRVRIFRRAILTDVATPIQKRFTGTCSNGFVWVVFTLTPCMPQIVETRLQRQLTPWKNHETPWNERSLSTQ